MFKKSRRRKKYLNPYKQETRRRNPEYKRGLFRRRRTLPKAKISLTTPRFRAREASGGIQRKIFFFLFLLGIGSLFYLLFFFPFWEVDEINILGEENIDGSLAEEIVRECLQGRRLFIFPKKNSIIVSRKEIIERLEERFAQILNVEVKKEFPDVLKVMIVEKKPVAIWANGAPRDLFLPPEAFVSDTNPEESLGEGEETKPNFLLYSQSILITRLLNIILLTRKGFWVILFLFPKFRKKI